MVMDDSAMARKHYVRLAVMTALSFAAMYVLMYAMVDRFDRVHPSLNQAYMAGLMTAPMVLIELALMGAMYPRKRLNLALAGASLAALALCWAGIRTQAGVGDRQFIKSMIPHHAGAVLMCGEAPITDPELRELCARIVRGQNEEIAQMDRILQRLGH
jgi:uncharacterized protein (DUF305 family)